MGLFSWGDKPATTSGTKVTTVPDILKPYVEETLKGTQELYRQRLGEGFQPYGGQTIAPFTEEELEAQEGLKSLIGVQAPLQEEALTGVRGMAERFTPEKAAQYMSPYMRAVTDERKRQAQREYERTKVPEFEADAVRAGGMSGLGTRAAVEAAERATGQSRLLEGIEAKGLQDAYKDAQTGFATQKAREAAQAESLQKLGQGIFKAGSQEQGLLQAIGEEKRKMGQSALDEAYYKYVQEREFPEQQLARYQSSIYGNPLLRTPNVATTGTQTPYSPGLGKTLLSAGISAAPKIMGFFKEGGQIQSGLSGLPQASPYIMSYRKTPGPAVDPKEVAKANAIIEAALKQDTQDFSTPQTSPTSVPSSQEVTNIADYTENVRMPIDAGVAGAEDEAAAGTVVAAKVQSPEFRTLMAQIMGVQAASQGYDTLITKLESLDTNISNKVKNLRTSMYDKVKGIIGDDKDKQQRFFNTIAVNVLKPGNPFANALIGYEQALREEGIAEDKIKEELLKLEKTMYTDEVKAEQDQFDRQKAIATLKGKKPEYLLGLRKTLADIAKVQSSKERTKLFIKFLGTVKDQYLAPEFIKEVGQLAGLSEKDLEGVINSYKSMQLHSPTGTGSITWRGSNATDIQALLKAAIRNKNK